MPSSQFIYLEALHRIDVGQLVPGEQYLSWAAGYQPPQGILLDLYHKKPSQVMMASKCYDVLHFMLHVHDVIQVLR